MRFVLALLVALAGCHSDPPPANPTEMPPLPPASGTPIGYLIDSASDLKLNEEQLTQLKDLDASLAAQDADIDVQLRQIEKPEAEEQQSPQQQKAHEKRSRTNMAPGASVQTNADAGKLHAMREQLDKAALHKAWTVLDKDQQVPAKKILEDRGVEVPGTVKAAAAPSEDGTPVPGMEP
jgi:hypothetical protein